jgi:hypothetical protein
MKAYTIRISKQADQEIENLHFYIFEICKSPITAKRYIEGLYSEIISLSYSAGSYPISNLKSILYYGYNARRINYKKVSIIFTIHGNIVLVHRVISGTMII